MCPSVGLYVIKWKDAHVLFRDLQDNYDLLEKEGASTVPRKMSFQLHGTSSLDQNKNTSITVQAVVHPWVRNRHHRKKKDFF